jgi:hypothetical protein
VALQRPVATTEYLFAAIAVVMERIMINRIAIELRTKLLFEESKTFVFI